MQNIYIIELNCTELNWGVFRSACFALDASVYVWCIQERRFSDFLCDRSSSSSSRGPSCCPAESGESPSASSGSSTTSIIHFHWSSHIASFSARTLRSAGMPPSSNGGRDSLGSAWAGGHRPRAVFGAWLGWRHEETNKNLIIAG